MTSVKKKQQIFMVGAFPPPVVGLAVINAAVRDQLQIAGVPLVIIDIVAPSLGRALWVRLGRVPKILRGLCCLALSKEASGSTLYMSVSGGLGQLYEILFLCLARLRGMRVFLHHHSFAYLDRPGWLTRMLTKIAGPSAIHITQSEGMAVRLRKLYLGVGRAIAISNVVYVIDNQDKKVLLTRSLRTIGFISNISHEKGIFEFLDLVEACETDRVDIVAKIAGPFQDHMTESEVLERVTSLNSAEYVGPKYGKQKDDFFSAIDVLVFPTRYTNETEGIVNHEAMSHGVPVIAYGRGCIPEFVSPESGLVVDPSMPFVPVALAKIKEWTASPEAFRTASRSAKEQFTQTKESNTARWKELKQEILNISSD